MITVNKREIENKTFDFSVIEEKTKEAKDKVEIFFENKSKNQKSKLTIPAKNLNWQAFSNFCSRCFFAYSIEKINLEIKC